MALPTGLTTVTASGTWTAHDGTAASGSVSFVPTNPRLVYGPDPTILVGEPVIVNMDSTGSVTAELVPTDHPDILGGAWNYTVTVYFNNSPSTPDLRYSFSLNVLTAGGPIDLSDFAPPVDQPDPGQTYVYSVNGFSGHLQVEAIVSDTWGSNFTVQGNFTAEQNATIGGDLTLDTPVAVEVGQALSTVMSTGVISGGEINAHAIDPQAVDISAVEAYVVDTNSVPGSPTVVRVSQPARTVSLDAQALLRPITWWLMDSSGAITQQASQPSGTQRRTHVVLGATAYDTALGQVIADQTLPVILAQPANQLADLMDALGAFRVSGYKISPNGANLSLDHSAGVLFSRAISHFNGPTLTSDPHLASLPAETAVPFRRILRAPSPSTPPLVTTIDPANYDLNGTLTAVGGGAGTATIQRIYAFATGDGEDDHVVQYGQTTHATLDAAAAAVGGGTFVESPAVATAVLVGYLCVTRTATNLSDPAQARFIHPGRFATP
jgi:hypothetical protein